jgi:CBS domain-containing protein
VRSSSIGLDRSRPADADEGESTVKVRDAMTPQVISVPPTMRLKELAALLSEHRISGAPVVEDGRVVGVVSEGDLLVKQVGRPPSRRRALEWIFGESQDPEEFRRRMASTVGQAMSAPAVTVEADRSLREAAALMVDSRVNRLPVTEEGKLVGMLTRADLVRAYLNRDDEAQRTIREQVIRKTMWIDPETIGVEVHEGLARIRGQVDRRSTATILGRLIGLVEGVDRVDNELTWEFDDSTIAPPAGEPVPGAMDLTARERPRPVRG